MAAAPAPGGLTAWLRSLGDGLRPIAAAAAVLRSGGADPGNHIPELLAEVARA